MTGRGRRAAAAVARRPDLLAVVALTVLISALSALWLWQFRRGQMVTVDEAAYLSGAFDDTTGWQHGGLLGVWQAWKLHGDFAPLVPLSAALFQQIFGTRILVAYLALDLWLGVLLIATASVARRLMSARWVVLAVVMMACIPAVIDATRDFYFAMPAAALLTATAAALLASNCLQRLGWTMAAGLLAGLTLLTRTVAVALVPGALIGALVLLAASPRRWRSARNLVAGAVAGMLIAATWYVPNLGAIYAYLTTYGYGPASTYYGVSHPPWDPAFWTARLQDAVQTELELPAALLIGVGLVAVAVMFVRRWRSGSLRPATPTILAGGVCVSVLAAGYLVLSSSANTGSGFELPLVPFAVCLAVAGLARLSWTPLRRTLAAVLLLSAAIVPVAKTGFVGVLVPERDATLPVLGTVAVVDGRGDIQRYALRHGAAHDDADELPAIDQRWLPAAAQLDKLLTSFAQTHGRQPVVCFATLDPSVSTNHLGLATRYILDAPPTPVAQLDPRFGGDSVANYVTRLSDPQFGQPNFLITGDASPRDFRPPVTMAYAVAAAQELGFQPAFEYTLPDGRHLLAWWLLRGPTLAVASPR